MPRRGTIQVNVTFGRHEAHLYEYLRAVAGERGVSRYIKELIEEDMLRAKGVRMLAYKMLLERAFKEWAWCPRCGTHAQLTRIEKTPEGFRFVYWCSDCGMGYSRVLTSAELSACEEAGRLISGLSSEAVAEAGKRRREFLERLKDKKGLLEALPDQ